MTTPCTPYPRGPVPRGTKRWDEGGRLDLDVESRGLTFNGREAVLDRHTGEWFTLAPYPCGLGCHCAAEAVWIDAEQVETVLTS